MKSLKKLALIVLGSLSLALGLIGMIIPVLPTTPFMLVAAYCYMRSSHRLYTWLLQHRLFGPTIRNYMKYRAIRSQTRNAAMIILWASLLFSIVMVDRLPVRLLLLVVGLGVSWHLATLRTLTPADAAEAEQQTRMNAPGQPAGSDLTHPSDRSGQQNQPDA